MPDFPTVATGGSQVRPTEPVERTVDVPGPSSSRSRRNPNQKRRIVEWMVIVAFAVLVAGGLRTFVVQAFYVPSGSMLPTLQIGDRIVVIKLGYTVHRGDIVVFKRPPKDVGTQDKDLVKRVIGMPGETISSRGSTVLINGRPLDGTLAAPSRRAVRRSRGEHPPHQDRPGALLRDGRLSR